LQGLSFEKVDELYEAGVPPRHFKKKAAAGALQASNSGMKQVEEKSAVVENP
jgi:hypothetical protein